MHAVPTSSIPDDHAACTSGAEPRSRAVRAGRVPAGRRAGALRNLRPVQRPHHGRPPAHRPCAPRRFASFEVRDCVRRILHSRQNKGNGQEVGTSSHTKGSTLSIAPASRVACFSVCWATSRGATLAQTVWVEFPCQRAYNCHWCAVAYLIAALVVLAFPPKAGGPAEGTAPWWIAGLAIFVTYICTSLLLRVRLFRHVHATHHVTCTSTPFLIKMDHFRRRKAADSLLTLVDAGAWLPGCAACSGARLQRRLMVGQQSAQTPAHVRSLISWCQHPAEHRHRLTA